MSVIASARLGLARLAGNLEAAAARQSGSGKNDPFFALQYLSDTCPIARRFCALSLRWPKTNSFENGSQFALFRTKTAVSRSRFIARTAYLSLNVQGERTDLQRDR